MGRKRKHRRDWGSITTVNRRKHIIRWVDKTLPKSQRQSKTLYCTYSEASFELDRIHVEVEAKYEKLRKEGKDPSNVVPIPTVGQAYEKWYKPWLDKCIRSGKRKEGTRTAYDSCWANVVAPRWDNVPANMIRPLDFQEWLDELSAGNAAHAIVIMRKILDFCVRYETIERNPLMMKFEMPTRKKLEKRVDTYSLDQLNEMFEQAKGNPVESSFILAGFGGARTGESLGVHPHEVSRMEMLGMVFAVVPIIRRMDKTGDAPLPDGDLKTPQSERVTVVPPPYSIRLLKIAQERISEGSEWMSDRGDGAPMNKTILRAAWEKFAKDDAIPFGNLRNSWRTVAQYEWQIGYNTLETLMGHMAKGTTDKHYLRPSIENLVKDVARAMVQYLES